MGAATNVMTQWYFADGNGMLLSGVTKSVYLAAKANLICKDAELKPSDVAAELDGEGDHEI